MRRAASTSLRSLSVPLPFLAIHTNTKPRSRWRLPWSLDSTMFCRSLRTLNAQRCSVGPQIPNMTGHDTHKPASSTRVGIALVLTVLATGAVAAQELPRSGQAALLPPRPDLILAEVEIPDGSSLNFRIRGTPVTLTNQAVACKSDPAPVTGHVKTIEILVDRTSIETFVNEGEVSLGALPPRRSVEGAGCF